MPDLSTALAVLRNLKAVSPPNAALGTLREQEKQCEIKHVPGVPGVPAQDNHNAKARESFCAVDVAERAAILEFHGGHCRADAERLALAEFGLSDWTDFDPPSAGRATR